MMTFMISIHSIQGQVEVDRGQIVELSSRIIPDRLSFESLARQVLIISEVNLVVDS